MYIETERVRKYSNKTCGIQFSIDRLRDEGIIYTRTRI